MNAFVSWESKCLSMCSWTQTPSKVQFTAMKQLFLVPALVLSLISCVPQTPNVAVNPLALLKNIKGVDPESFNYGDCAYLHGEDGEVRKWEAFSSTKRESLSALLQNQPLVKLDYSKNPNNVSDEIYVGPLCNCLQFESAKKEIEQRELDFGSVLAHGTGELTSCIDFSEFR